MANDEEWSKKHSLEMYKSLTDPDMISENRRKERIRKEKERKKSDAGL